MPNKLRAHDELTAHVEARAKRDQYARQAIELLEAGSGRGQENTKSEAKMPALEPGVVAYWCAPIEGKVEGEGGSRWLNKIEKLKMAAKGKKSTPVLARTTFERADIWAAALEEIMQRNASIYRFIELSDGVNIDIGSGAEACYTQFRMIAETIAQMSWMLSQPVDYEITESTWDTWQANYLLNKVAAPEFYPQPAEGVYRSAAPDGEPIGTTPIDVDHLTAERLKELSHECGRMLHRGIPRRNFSVLRQRPDFDQIRLWQTRIENLLRTHRISVITPDAVRLCTVNVTRSVEGPFNAICMFLRAAPVPGGSNS